ncbi:lysophospholipid acyltransferase family protein [Priestia aryabhattai]|uniref:lysophospholipid acyltransferase family protein n=1 Tax=Priestia aryabhattai TaxID=412384 RepID=UPI003D293E6C
MIYPKKNSIFERFFQLFVTYQLKKQFYRIHLHIEELPKDKKMLLIANHSSWWDGLVTFYLNNAVLKTDLYAMMSEQGMKDFPFFQRIGAFSVNAASPKHTVESLRFASRLLADKKAVLIFPQGKEEHLEKRPLAFSEGPAFLLKKQSDVEVIPITYYYTFRHDQRPELFIWVGQAVFYDLANAREDITKTLAGAVTDQLDHQKQKIIQENDEEFTVLLKGRKTLSEWLTWWKAKVKE